ncbi:hypothetical protein FHS57_001205 [Runella defluvii]|uniref:Uncharacterized protein n=1 Tax=Runella defluvii TaxID=370973 RepID=A0A7W6EPC7_9BACT|nr:hypothetical protein [Runella defluvii]MBB3837211.1 hypothetical protein [Runella defluvii]
MGLRKCVTQEAWQAAKICGYRDEHELKRAYCYGSVSNADIFIDTDKQHEIVIADKDGSYPSYKGYYLK